MFKAFEEKIDTTKGQELSTTQFNFRVSYASIVRGRKRKLSGKEGKYIKKQRKLNIEEEQLNLLKWKC